MKKSAIRNGKILVTEGTDTDAEDELLTEGYSDSGDGVDKASEINKAEKEMDEEKEVTDNVDKVSGHFDPNLDADEENRRLKLLPEEEFVDEAFKKKLDAEDDDEKDDDDGDKDKKKKAKKESLDITESFEKMFEGQDLTEEFKAKVLPIFEAAVAVKAKMKNEALKRKCLKIIKEEKQNIEKRMVESVEKLMNHFSNVWFKENRINVVDGVTVELAEGAINSTKAFLSKYNVRVPRSKENLVEKLSLRNSALQSDLDESMRKNIELQENLNKIQKQKSIRDLSEGLSDIDREKFVTLAEEVSFPNEDSYRAKLKAIRSGLFESGSKKTGAEDFAEKMLMEKKDPEKKSQNPDSSIRAYMAL